MIWHVIAWCVMGGITAWGVLYQLRWNRSDEAWLHRHGYCRARYDICEGHMETKAHARGESSDQRTD